MFTLQLAPRFLADDPHPLFFDEGRQHGAADLTGAQDFLHRCAAAVQQQLDHPLLAEAGNLAASQPLGGFLRILELHQLEHLVADGRNRSWNHAFQGVAIGAEIARAHLGGQVDLVGQQDRTVRKQLGQLFDVKIGIRTGHDRCHIGFQAAVSLAERHFNAAAHLDLIGQRIRNLIRIFAVECPCGIPQDNTAIGHDRHPPLRMFRDPSSQTSSSERPPAYPPGSRQLPGHRWPTGRCQPAASGPHGSGTDHPGAPRRSVRRLPR